MFVGPISFILEIPSGSKTVSAAHCERRTTDCNPCANEEVFFLVRWLVSDSCVLGVSCFLFLLLSLVIGPLTLSCSGLYVSLQPANSPWFDGFIWIHLRVPRGSWIWLKERILAFLHINGVDATLLISNLYKSPGSYTWDVLARMHRDQEPNSSVNHIIVTSGTTYR